MYNNKNKKKNKKKKKKKKRKKTFYNETNSLKFLTGF